MTVSKLATQTVPADPSNYTKGRDGKKVKKITIHHMGGVLTAEQCGRIFQPASRNGSSHYGIGYNGDIANYVDEDNTAWTDSNWESNTTSVTIENSNSAAGGMWPVSEATINSLVELCADIALRYNLGELILGKTLTWHNMYAATDCPGPTLKGRLGEVASRANEIIRAGALPTPVPEPTPEPTPSRYTNEQIANMIVYGPNIWGNNPERKQKLEAEGYDYNAIQSLVNFLCGVGANPKPTELKVGDKVDFVKPVSYDGVTLAKLHPYYTISQIVGNRVVINWGNTVYAAVHKDNLYKV